MQRIRKLLVANRGEIAIRVMRAATELGIRTVSVHSHEDRFALHRFKADESYWIGRSKRPVEAYLDIEDMVAIARMAGADAVHPGYGFLSENPDFAEACAAAGLIFIGPPAAVMRRLGNKISARALAQEAGVPVVPASGPLPDDPAAAVRIADEIGFPVMLKASWGGGGRGMRVIAHAGEVAEAVEAARREAAASFGNDEVYFEKLIGNARHVEVQVLADAHGSILHLFERDCTVQRRHQKIVERAPAPYLDDDMRAALCESARAIARTAGYVNAGTVEFLQDADSGQCYFIEVNPRIQVEHTVTECVTGIDIVKAQIRIAEGARAGDAGGAVPSQDEIAINGHAIQCRVTTENPELDFAPDHGRIHAYRSASGFGIRLDAGNAFPGALITPYYDSLLVKITAWGRTPDEAATRMDRALREFRVRGVATNLRFLEAVIGHADFRNARCTTRFIDQTPELLRFAPRRDRASRLLSFLGEVIVNGNPEVAGHARPKTGPAALPRPAGEGIPPAGTRQKLAELGAEGLVRWVAEQDRVLLTDTTLRDAHQSLLATRMRTHDLVGAVPAYAQDLTGLFSLECWGGATFDVAMRFLNESPWDRLARISEACPNILLQMLLRGANAVGYTSYPDNVVRHFVGQAAEAGIDVFRIFDSLNWVENMRVAIDAVRETGKICEVAICYTGDVDDPARRKYDLGYYVGLAHELADAGTQILGIKDMAGVCRPQAARKLVHALKEAVGLPIHFHTHDTSGIAAASVLAAADAGADIVDAALDSMSGLTSQPNLGAIVEALRRGPRDTGIDPARIRALSDYFEQVRRAYAPFESDMRWGASEVYVHEMPGGQYTNLRQQAAALGLADRWPDVARTYAEVNAMFGDVIKVTPTSKTVGDMALAMVTRDLSVEQVLDPAVEVAFPASVISFFRGEIGQPPGGFPAALQEKVLGGEAPLTVRPGAVLEPVDLASELRDAEKAVHRHIDERELASYLMYPKVFIDYARTRRQFGDVSVLPSLAYFYGMEPGEEIDAGIEQGKRLIIRFLALGDADEHGDRSVFFELNGQPRSIRVVDRTVEPAHAAHPRADADDPCHVGAPMQGVVIALAAEPGQTVRRGDPLLTLEAMKMEMVVRAELEGTVADIIAPVGTAVSAGDLLVELTPAAQPGPA